jgi:hypothetical protein
MCSLFSSRSFARVVIAAAIISMTCLSSVSAQILDRDRTRLIDRQPGAERKVVLRLTAEAFAPIVDRDVDETLPVRDVIVGTPVRGNSRTTGKPSVTLIDDDKSASFLLTLKGTAVSRTVGNSPPALIYSRSETYFTATKRVVFEPGKGFVAQPARINATTRIITEGIGSTRPGLRGRIVQRRAGPLVAAARPAAEEETRQKAMRRITATFDRQLEGRLERLNRAADMREAIAFVLRGDTEPRYEFCTKDGCIQIVASTGAGDTPAAAVELPKLEKPGSPIQLWVHGSVAGDNLSFLLTRIDALRREPGPVVRTLGALAEGLQQPASSAAADKGSGSPIDYATAGDWIVLQFQAPENGRSQPARIGQQVSPAATQRRR